MHHVGSLASTPSHSGVYDGHSERCTRLGVLNGKSGALHQSIEVVELGAGGRVDRHAHAFEEAVYVLEGSPALDVAGRVEELAAHDVCFVEKGVSHSFE